MRGQVLLPDTSYTNGREFYPDRGEIYQVFANEKYSLEDEYHFTLANISKYDIY